jgi:tetratricopeptide (TPR) repeat protein
MLAFADTSLNALGINLQPKLPTGRFDGEYDRGMRALDDHKYDAAVRSFDAVINAKSTRADGALYWKAYALNRLGRRDDALAAIAQLRRDYAGSHWLNDAQALEAEVRQSSGQAVSPAQESNEDLKLFALNSLMNNDPERAIPQIEGVLKGNSSPKVKDRALFVLTQSQSPQAQQLLMTYAKGAGNPDLQLRALRYIGMSGSSDVRQQLVSIYNGSSDAEVKRQILQSLMMSRDKDALFNIAKAEKDQSLRLSAIRQLGAMRGVEQLTQLYTADSVPEVKRAIVEGLFAAQASDKLLDIVRNERDQSVRRQAVMHLAMTNAVPPDALLSLYTSETDTSVKRQLVNGLRAHDDAKLMIDLARKETDPQMKIYIVQQLGTMRDNKEATDYLLELLK